MAHWNRESLSRHFEKRMRKDGNCVPDVLGKPADAISIQDYERESLGVLKSAWICYLGESLDTDATGYAGVFYHPFGKHFVDKRLLTTIVSQTDTVVTCYHKHFGTKHKATQRPDEQLVRYLESLQGARKCGMVRKFTAVHLSPRGPNSRMLEVLYELVKSTVEPPEAP